MKLFHEVGVPERSDQGAFLAAREACRLDPERAGGSSAGLDHRFDEVGPVALFVGSGGRFRRKQGDGVFLIGRPWDRDAVFGPFADLVQCFVRRCGSRAVGEIVAVLCHVRCVFADSRLCCVVRLLGGHVGVSQTDLTDPRRERRDQQRSCHEHHAQRDDHADRRPHGADAAVRVRRSRWWRRGSGGAWEISDFRGGGRG